jgi:glycosyltransferase involved in cell wall biosynthesis
LTDAMRGLRIGLVIGQLHRGGAETQLVALAEGLKRDHDMEPVVYCLSRVTEPNGPRLQRAGVTVHAFSRRGLSRLTRPWRLRRSLSRDRIDVVNAHLLGPTVQTSVAILGTGMPFVSSYWSADLVRPAIWKRLESWAMGATDLVTANSRAGSDFVHSYYGVPSAKLRLISSGVTLAGLPARAEARRSLGLPEDAPVVLGLFRLSPEKELDLFCRVVEGALGDLPGSTCLIAGDGPLRGWLEERVRGSSHRQCFRLLGPSDEVPTLLAAADLMLLTSRFEGMPSAVLEAMAAALPVVATRVGDVPRLVENGESGFLLPSGDEAGLLRGCREILESPALRRRMGERALALARSRFSMENMIDGYARVYRDVSRRARAPAAAAGS